RVERAILLRGELEGVPDLAAATRRPEPGNPELATHAGHHLVQSVEPVEALPGHDVVDLEGEPLARQEIHRPAGPGERAGTADGIVDVLAGAVHADLHVEVVSGGDPASGGAVHERAVGAELDPDPVGDGVVHQLEEVWPGHRLPAPDVDVEDPHL